MTLDRDGVVPVDLYFINALGDEARNMVAGEFAMKAIEMSLVEFNAEDEYGRLARGDESTQKVYVISCDGFTWGPWKERVGKTAETSYLMSLVFSVRDYAP